MGHRAPLFLTAGGRGASRCPAIWLSRQPRAGRIGEKAYSGTYMGCVPGSAARRPLGHGPGGGQVELSGCSARLRRGSPTVMSRVVPADGGHARWPERLPVPLTDFIGRTQERAEVAQLLSSARLVTLVGAGGVGKTRLAVEVAASVAHGFAGAVDFVDLAPVRRPGVRAGHGGARLGAGGVGGRRRRGPAGPVVAHRSAG